ncbi:MAG: hypothetical protein OIF50_11765 [Flavobacteriaceae bacterium]|nr:hypothetical protein [Flavobacteriaceae bacterium]
MNKKIISLFLLYFLQFYATSCIPCNCDPVRTYERIYNGLEIKAWDTSKFQNEEITDSVYKNAFGLTISVEFELNQIASLHKATSVQWASFGFASAYAMSCDCPPDEYKTVDPIESIVITVTDVQSQKTTDITDNFYTTGYNAEQITIGKLFENRDDWHDHFRLDLVKYDNIPDTSVFEIRIILESGKELVEQTQQIIFI